MNRHQTTHHRRGRRAFEVIATVGAFTGLVILAVSALTFTVSIAEIAYRYGPAAALLTWLTEVTPLQAGGLLVGLLGFVPAALLIHERSRGGVRHGGAAR